MIVVAKLISGELIIGRLENQVIKKPFVFLGDLISKRIVLAPYLMELTKNDPSIPLDKVICYEEAKEEVSSDYVRVSSGLIVSSTFDLNNGKKGTINGKI